MTQSLGPLRVPRSLRPGGLLTQPHQSSRPDAGRERCSSQYKAWRYGQTSGSHPTQRDGLTAKFGPIEGG